MHAIRHSSPSVSSLVPPAFADDFALVESAAEHDREDGLWSDLPLPVSVTLPLDADMTCEAVLPAHYEPRYAYPLLIWIQPGDDIAFRDRVAAISDRNYFSIALYWAGFDRYPTPSIPRVAECHGLLQSALRQVGSLWNTHRERACLIAEGGTECAWARRLFEHAPDGIKALICLHPTPWVTADGDVYRVPPRNGNSVLAVSDDADVIETWRTQAAKGGWSIASAPDGDAGGRSTPRLINAWLMSRIARH